MNFQNTEIHQLKVQILLQEPLFAENQNKVCIQTISTPTTWGIPRHITECNFSIQQTRRRSLDGVLPSISQEDFDNWD